MPHITKAPFNIYIYNPSMKTGGTNNLLGNLAHLLANGSLHNVHYIDYYNSPVRKHLETKTSKINYINFDSNKIQINDGLLIATLLDVKLIGKNILLDSTIRMLFWSTHPDDGLKIIPSFNLWLRLPIKFSKIISKIIHPFYKERLRQFLVNAMNNKGIVWMDEENIDNNKKFYKLNNRYLIWPIITDNPKFQIQLNEKIFEQELRIVILGRLTNFKVYPLFGLFEQIRGYNSITKKQIFIDFIGDGPLKNDLEKKLLEKEIQNYRFLGHINLKDLDGILSEYHLLIGMGTSTLEGAKLKLPSLLSDASYDVLDSSKVKLRWLNEVKPFDVARFVSNADKEIIGKTFSEVMWDIENSEKWFSRGKDCYHHWKLYHSPDSLLDIVTSTIESNSFFYSKENEKLLKIDFLGKAINKIKYYLQ